MTKINDHCQQMFIKTFMQMNCPPQCKFSSFTLNLYSFIPQFCNSLRFKSLGRSMNITTRQFSPFWYKKWHMPNTTSMKAFKLTVICLSLNVTFVPNNLLKKSSLQTFLRNLRATITYTYASLLVFKLANFPTRIILHLVFLLLLLELCNIEFFVHNCWEWFYICLQFLLDPE